MDLSAKYEELGPIGGVEIRVVRGRARMDGRSVLLHQFDNNPELLKLAVEYLLTQPSSPRLLDIGEYGTASCLVTVQEPELLDVELWLRAQLRGSASLLANPPPIQPPAERPAPPARVQPSSPPPSDSPAPGEFTRLFHQSGGTNPSSPPHSAPPPVDRRQPEPERAPPGEFTSLFGGGPRPGGASTPYSPAPDPLYSSPGNAAPLAPPTPRKPAGGEFTRLFGSDSPANADPIMKPPARSASLPPSPPPQPRPPAAPPAPRGPSEYTRVMQGPAPTDMTAAGAEPAAADSGQTPVIPAMPSQPATPRVPSGPLTSSPSMPSIHISATPPAVPSVSTPSAPRISTPVPPAPRRAEMTPRGERPNWTPYIVLFGALVVAALLLILIFALRR